MCAIKSNTNTDTHTHTHTNSITYRDSNANTDAYTHPVHWKMFTHAEAASYSPAAPEAAIGFTTD